MTKKILIKYLVLTFCLSQLSCKRPENLEDISDKLASPSDIVNSADGSVSFILNADVDKVFKNGSILAIGSDRTKIGTVETPRLGRFLVRQGNILIAGFNPDDKDLDANIVLYNVADPANMQEVARFPVDCFPVSASVSEGYKYFSVSCIKGQLYVGEIKDPIEESTLNLVRRYNRLYRAMQIDAKRGLIYLFPTDIGAQFAEDAIIKDEITVKSDDTIDETPNGVPDIYETLSSSKSTLGTSDTGQRYKMIVFDINASASAEPPFNYIDSSNKNATEQLTFKQEHRWIYFTLFDFDGAPDLVRLNPDDANTAKSPEIIHTEYKFYRTNFYATHDDPDDPNSFYASHRSKRGNYYFFSNNILRFSIVGNPRVTDGVAPKFSEFAQVERVYGFRGELRDDGQDFPGDFVVRYIKGRKTLLVNHFKDLSSFSRKEQSYRVSVKLLDGSQWLSELESKDAKVGYYNLSVNRDGVGYSCLFYTNQLIRFEVNPGNDIKSESKDDVSQADVID